MIFYRNGTSEPQGQFRRDGAVEECDAGMNIGIAIVEGNQTR
jgi:hypothetical protein